MKLNNPSPLVSICCITYNQEKYISDAIEGFLMQKTKFPIEIVIHDDSSTDSTAQIIRKYAEKDPRIVPILRETNIKSTGVPVLPFTFNVVRGKYIALCEGDDYWTDPLKLQKQVDFLEANPEYGLIFTDADFLYERDGKLIPAYDKIFGKRIPTGNVLPILLQGKNPYKTCTSMFRRSLMGEYADISNKSKFKMGDKILWLIIAGQAKIGYIDHSTAVYRIREKSASHFEDLDDFISFLKSSYRVSVFFSKYYNFPLDRKKYKQNYKKSILTYCVNKKQYKMLLKYAGCFPLALAANAKELLRELIFLVKKRHK